MDTDWRGVARNRRPAGLRRRGRCFGLGLHAENRRHDRCAARCGLSKTGPQRGRMVELEVCVFRRLTISGYEPQGLDKTRAAGPREIVHHGGDDFAALCRDPHKQCADRRLGTKDVLLCTLDLYAFLKPVLPVPALRGQQFVLRRPGVSNIGLSNRRSSLNQPCYLLIFEGPSGFQSAVRDLLLDVPGPFVIVAPTNQHRTGAVQELAEARNYVHHTRGPGASG